MVEVTPVVVVVEDEPGLADLYTAWLETACDVRTAYTGEEAVEHLDPDVDVALIDRRLPDLTGTELVEHVVDRGLDCRMAMVTAVDADLDIVDIPVDTYLRKPVERGPLRATVEELYERGRSPGDERELLALRSRKRALEAELPQTELQSSEEFSRLEERIERLADALDAPTAPIPSKYRPRACDRCDLRWDLSVGGTVGFVKLSSAIWKCTGCGNLQGGQDPNHRRFLRR